MISDYIDKWGRYHDKICLFEEPSSNNGWIYTAYAWKFDMEVDREKISDCFRKCLFFLEGKTRIARSPYKFEPPISRDEILGLAYLDLLGFRNGNWNFSPYVVPSFNPFKTIAALYRMIGAHRNALWFNGGEPHLFRFAFSVPLQDRAFLLRNQGSRVPLLYRVVEWIDKLIPSSSDSSKMIRWLKYGKLPAVEVFTRLYGEQHPFTERARIAWASP